MIDITTRCFNNILIRYHIRFGCNNQQFIQQQLKKQPLKPVLKKPKIPRPQKPIISTSHHDAIIDKQGINNDTCAVVPTIQNNDSLVNELHNTLLHDVQQLAHNIASSTTQINASVDNATHTNQLHDDDDDTLLNSQHKDNDNDTSSTDKLVEALLADGKFNTNHLLACM